MTVDVIVELVLKTPLRSPTLLYPPVRVTVMNSQSFQTSDETLQRCCLNEDLLYRKTAGMPIEQ
jgi:hypothetical protein